MAALSGLPGLSPTPTTIREMDILPSVKGDLRLRSGVLHPTQTPDMEYFDATHTTVRGLPLDIKPAPGALRCIKHVVDNEQGGQLLLVRRLCLVALAPAVGLRPRLGLPGNFGAKRRTKRTCLIQRLPPVVHELVESGDDLRKIGRAHV